MWTILSNGMDVIEACMTTGLWGSSVAFAMADFYPESAGFVEYAGGFHG